VSSLKKKKYFTIKNREKKIKKWIKILDNFISGKKEINFNLNKSALLIIDMQNYFLDSSSHAYLPSGETIIKPIEKLINIFQINNRPVIFTQYGKLNSDNNDTIMGRWWGEELSFEDPLSEIIPPFKLNDENIIKKSSYDAFIGTNLQELLEKLNVHQLFITGVVTHLCCETTARSAFCRGFQVWMVIDCLASRNEELHLSSLKAAAHGFATPIISDILLEKLKHE